MWYFCWLEILSKCCLHFTAINCNFYPLLVFSIWYLLITFNLGHMIHDTRPPTVVSNRPQGPGHSSSSNISTSPSVLSTSSNAVVSGKTKKQRPRSRTQLGNDLARLSTNLMERSNQLHSAHVHQTMTFYSRLKDYIAFISTPSLRKLLNLRHR